MKHLYVILAGLALCGSALTGCSEDYLPGREENTANAGIEADVPEGYVRVSFVPQDETQTRTAVNGISNAIFRVQAFLYHENTLIDDEIILNTDEGKAQSWPYTSGSTYSKTLERGKTYTIVYLGNVPDDKLSGMDDKTTARIAAPDGNLFHETNMYYFFSKEFTVPTGESQKSLEIPVMLRRLASRHIIGGYGIPEGIEAERKEYEDKYYVSLLDENHPLGIGRKLFSGMESEMGKSFKDLLIHDIVFPNTYMLDSKYITDGSPLATWWVRNKDSYWSNYTRKQLFQEDLETAWNQASSSNWYGRFNGGEEQPNALFTLLNAIVDKKNENILNDIFEGIKEKDYGFVDEGGVKQNPGSYTATRQKITNALEKSLQNTPLGVWNRNSQISLTVEKVPTLLDFSLNAIKSEALTIENQAIDRADTREPNFTFLLLGTKSDSYSFASSCQISGVSTPESDFAGQALAPNVSNSYRVRPTGELNWNETTDEQAAVYFSYYYVMEQLLKELRIDIELNDWIADNGPLCFAMCPLYNLSSTSWFIWEDNGLLAKDYKAAQTCIKFSIPDFSGATAGDVEWVVESSTGNGD